MLAVRAQQLFGGQRGRAGHSHDYDAGRQYRGQNRKRMSFHRIHRIVLSICTSLLS